MVKREGINPADAARGVIAYHAAVKPCPICQAPTNLLFQGWTLACSQEHAEQIKSYRLPCEICGELRHARKEVDGQMMCPDCEKEYRTEYPDPAEEAAKAEWYQDTRGDR